MKSLIPICLALALAMACRTASAAEYQWSVAVPTLADRPNESPRAFLWIPPNCQRVRGIVFGHHNMEEEAIFAHPDFRKAAADINFAIIWVAPGFDAHFRFDQGAGEKFDKMLADLAGLSGYGELVGAPIVPLGHSAAASVPWFMAAWKPERILAGMSISGQFPYVWDEKNQPHVANATVDTVPGIMTTGEYEWADDNLPKGLKIRAGHPMLPFSALGCPADGHFFATDEKIAFLALYLKKAAQFRLPSGPATKAGVKLLPIDPTKSGWLADRYRSNNSPSAPAAPVGKFTGDPAQAYWYFDGELAKAAEVFQQQNRGEPALLGYIQNNQVVPQVNGTHQQVTLAFLPDDDGVTFHLKAGFLDTVPEGRPAKWTKKQAGETLTWPSGGPPITIHRITGPIEQVADHTWRIAFNRASFLGDRRGNEAWFAAVWPGDATYKRAIQQAMMKIPTRQKDGNPQTITFEPPARIRNGSREITLRAKSDAGLPVRIYVRDGPATMDGDRLVLGAIPPRAKFPIAITVVAWQFGRFADPKIQSADPVIRTIELTK